MRENYLIAERMKLLAYTKQHKTSYFWRTTQQQEIDYIEYADEMYNVYELKRSPKKNPKLSLTFATAYPHSYQYIHTENFESFLTS